MLQSHVEVLSALRLGWSVFATVYGFSGKEFVVYDSREDDWLIEWQVQVLEGWRTPERVWAIKAEMKVDDTPAVKQEKLW